MQSTRQKICFSRSEVLVKTDAMINSYLKYQILTPDVKKFELDFCMSMSV